jgi:hypothetical protein
MPNVSGPHDEATSKNCFRERGKPLAERLQTIAKYAKTTSRKKLWLYHGFRKVSTQALWPHFQG